MTLRKRKEQSDTTPEGVKTPQPSPKVKSKKSEVQASLPRVLLFGMVQGILVGALGGWLLGSLLWQNAPAELSDLLALQPPRKCPSCPPVVECPAPICDPYPLAHQCVSKDIDLFMNKEDNVDDYHNKRMHYVSDILTPEECLTLIYDSGAVEMSGGSLLAFPKEGSWEWLYHRLHGAVLEANERFWHHRLPQSHMSQLLDKILIMKYTNDTDVLPDYQWGQDIGTYGRTGKRVLGGHIVLNYDYEGGVYQTLVAEEASDIIGPPRLMWMYPSFLLKRKTKVTQGAQYVLFYRLRRY